LYKIAVLGEKDSVIGFSALGLDVFPVEDSEEAYARFRALTRDTDAYAIIYITETYYAALEQEIAKFKDTPTPAVILIPGAEGSRGLGLNALNDAVERAVGANIL